ncbi:MAG: PQQ-dependent sugar dehydrogenase [Fimbriimonadaceae bacterium]
MKKRFVCAILSLLAASISFGQPLKVQVYVTGLNLPIGMIQDPTNPSVQFVTEQRGLIRVVVNGVVQPSNFLNLVGIVHPSDGEGGLLGLAFHPNYATNRLFYVSYTDTAGDTRIVRYTRNAGNPLLADPGSAQQVLFIDQPFANHNGGTIKFGPLDNYLYIGMGDGGSSNDPGNRAQTLTGTLLGKMLRIDVNSDDFPADPNRNYHVPSNNPFVGIAGDDEIWSYGLRNPWKWSFDNPVLLGTGGMLIGDVGQGQREEVNYEPPLAGGRNYGWRVYEGNLLTGLGGGVPPYVFPITEYTHSDGFSITGGHVYRGLLLGDFFGRYFFADYVTQKVWSCRLVINGITGEGSATDLVEHTADLAAGAKISSIDVDSNGEIYLMDHRSGTAGRILRIMPENRVWATSLSPDLLTPLIGNTRSLSTADGLNLRTLQLADPTVGRLFQSAFFLNMATDMTAPSFFDVFIDVQTSENIGAANLQVHMRNWVTGNLDPIGTLPIGSTLETKQILNIPAGNYRRASDGAVQLRCYVSNIGVRDSSRYQIIYDRVKVSVR